MAFLAGLNRHKVFCPLTYLFAAAFGVVPFEHIDQTFGDQVVGPFFSTPVYANFQGFSSTVEHHL